MNTEDDFHHRPAWVYLPLVLLFVFLVLSGWQTIADPSFWTRLAEGRAMAASGMPRADTLSFTAADKPWIDANWLYDRILFGLYQAAGAGGVTVLHVLAVAAAFGLAGFAARRWAGPLAFTGAAALAAWVLLPVLQPRPELFCMVFPAFFLFWFARPRSPAASAAVLLPLQVVWANLGAMYLLGPVITLVAAADYLAERRAAAGGAMPDERRRAVSLALLAGALLLACLVNPYGPRLLGATVSAWRDPAQRMFPFWVSPVLGLLGVPPTRHLLTAMLLLGALGLITQKGRLPVTLTALAVFGAFLVIRGVRHLAMFAVLGLPFLALSARATGETLRDLLAGRVGRGLPYETLAAGALAAVLAVSAGFAVSGAALRRAGSLSTFGTGTVDALYPSGAIGLLADEAFPERSIHMPFDGGYLAWARPGRKVFVDSRLGLYGEDFLRLLARFLSGDAGAQTALLRRWKAGAVVLNCLSPGGSASARSLLEDGTRALVYFDGTTAVILPRNPANAGQVERTLLEQPGLALLEQEVRAAEARADAGRRGGVSPRLLGAAQFLGVMERNAEAEAFCRLVLRLLPRASGFRVRMGICQAKQGKWNEAAGTLEEERRAIRENATALFWLSAAYERTGRASAARRVSAELARLSDAARN